MLKYLATLVAVCLLLAACGYSRREPAAPSSTKARSEIELLNRAPTAKDKLPSGTEQQLARTVIVDRPSVRHAATFTRGWSIWVFKGVLSGPAALGASEVACLAVLDRHEQILAEKCAAERALSEPGALMVVLSGGAKGAPGWMPREVLIAGTASASAGDVAILTEAGDSRDVANSDGVFAVTSRSIVEAVAFGFDTSEARVVPIKTCQSC